MSFDYVVSLGGACQVAYQLRRTFNFGTAFPFDWCVTNFLGVMDALDPAKDPYADLEEVLTPEGQIAHIRKTDHNVELPHDFPRGDDRYVVPNWREHVGTARSRFGYLRTRLLGLKSSRILFVRHKGNSIITAPTTNAASLGDLVGFVGGIFPRSRFMMINVPEPHSSLDVMTLPSHDDSITSRWRDNHEAWKHALSGFKLENPTLAPFVEKAHWGIW